jgi:sugar lactone lactonase YvrE
MRNRAARRSRSVRPACLIALALLALTLALALPLAAGAERAPLDLRVFARVGQPGQPEPIAIGPEDGLVYVGTNQLERGDTHAPSKIFVYSRRGELRREYVIRGQPLEEPHGIQGLAFDGRGRLFALDRSDDPRVLVIDPATGRQRTYSRFRDVPPCQAAGRTRNCSATLTDATAEPDYAAFGPGGALYVTDIEQALIWRVARGGGRPSVWMTDPRLESIFGPNGIQFMADRRTLMLAVTSTRPGSEGEPASGALYTLRLRRDGKAGPLKLFWRSRPFDGPDGFALGRSGKVYLALAGASQIVVISPAGEELARVPDPLENLSEEIPVDAPGSVAFLGRRALVTNHSAIRGDPQSWAVLDLYVGERGLPLHYPRIRPRR